MSSPALNIVEESVNTLEDAKRLISPLPADQQEWLDKARAQTGDVPEAANAANEMLESGTLLTDTDLYAHEIAQEIAKITKLDKLTYFEKGEIAEEIATKIGVTPVVFATTRESAAEVVQREADPNAMDAVRAANDTWEGGGAAFATYESDVMKDIIGEHSLRVNTKTDGDGRRFFHFDNGVNINLAVVLFEMKGVKMVKLQNTIISLDALLSLKHCVNLPDCEEKEKRLVLRSSPIFQGGVECTFEGGVTLTIPGISVDSLMIIISHLSQIYAQTNKLEGKIESQVETKTVAPQQPLAQQNDDDDLAIIISHAVVGFASMFMGVLIGRYIA